ncbi:satratoxin biosynthesis SC1 cluster protein 4 [Colletotrichum spaethianum]|uniref:Satratoxin biosynthesis SC1 cluster protein 4 n=1 Tax=Colletotrichum spaethianum TaxID=700344 RepID=A0AA37PF94_9PEZI|nr:satratoxin biosynthesis SC1 cluster protein 4 [Colletotrichum spaethianum]GKT51114.1 satratoxin biosynthesis SC1 cluster protein 4 [Colletotrichum spaethianum]
MWTITEDDLVAAAPPPPGVQSNFENPTDSLVPQVLAVAIVLNLLAILFCAIRLYTAKVVILRHQLDDNLIFVALVFATAYSAIQIYETRNGEGHHIWDVSKNEAIAFHKLSMADLAAYSLSVFFTKVSILVFYLRFPLKRTIKIAVYVVMFATVAYSMAGALSWAYLCTPMEKIWNTDLPGTCVDRAMWWLMLSVSDVATDLAILLLPIWILSPLSMRLVKKIEMTIFLMAGGFVIGPSVVRLVMIPLGFNTSDFTWTASISIIWCVVEANVGIICTCLPFLKAFIKHVAPNIAKRFYMSNEPQSPTVFDRAAALQSLPQMPKSVRRKSFGRQAANDVPDAEMKSVHTNWPLKNNEPFGHVEYRHDQVSGDQKSPHAVAAVDVAEMV